MKYLSTNEYGLNPMYAEYITEKIKGDELSNINVALNILVGNTIGKYDEHGKLAAIKDTINININNKYFGDLIINGTKLYTTLIHGLKQEEFIQVSFRTLKDGRNDNKLLDKFLGDKVPLAVNSLGHTIYSFLIIHKDDLENAHSIILNMLEEKIVMSIEAIEIEKIAYIKSIKDKYKQYM